MRLNNYEEEALRETTKQGSTKIHPPAITMVGFRLFNKVVQTLIHWLLWNLGCWALRRQHTNFGLRVFTKAGPNNGPLLGVPLSLLELRFPTMDHCWECHFHCHIIVSEQWTIVGGAICIVTSLFPNNGPLLEVPIALSHHCFQQWIHS